MRGIDAELFAELGEVMLIGSVEVPGVFINRPREIEMTDGTFVGLSISFDCQMIEKVQNLERGALVKIIGNDDEGNTQPLGTYTFQRRVPEQGDESGLVILELGLP